MNNYYITFSIEFPKNEEPKIVSISASKTSLPIRVVEVDEIFQGEAYSKRIYKGVQEYGNTDAAFQAAKELSQQVIESFELF